MPTPFPGMDPYLEHPDLWPDVHNRLIAAIADSRHAAPSPKFFIALQERVYEDKEDDLSFFGLPDASVIARHGEHPAGHARPVVEADTTVAVEDVEVPIETEAREWFLEVRATAGRTLVTVLELLSPSNKRPGEGRKVYLAKREKVLATRTHLVEIDLLRAGPPMPIRGTTRPDHYRILISRGNRRPRSTLYTFGLRTAIPAIPIPLLPGDDEPPLDLNDVLHALYDRARFDLRIDYAAPADPPLPEPDAASARERIGR